MRKLLLAPVLAALVLLGLGSGTSVTGAEEEPEPTDTEQDCFQDVPYSVSPLWTDRPDDGATIDLPVAVLTDGVPIDRVHRIVAKAAETYAPLGITLRAASVTAVSMPAKGQGPTGRPAADPTAAIAFAKAHFGGARPAGADLVYLITTKDLVDPELGDGVAGMADCIGGVRWADRAFAVGELDDSMQYSIGPLKMFARYAVKIFAHELGHLMGAHHHYANCIEALGPEDLSEDTGPCTLMLNFIDLQGLRFASLEGAVIRGHATDFARP